MSGHRRAAVALYGLSAADRQWILAALPGKDRDALRRYLGEIKGLGFEQAGPLAEALDWSAPQASGVASVRPADTVRRASAAQVFACLQGEQAALVAQIFLIEDWPWTQPLLQLFPAARQERIRAAMAGGRPVAPARKAFLLEATAVRLAALAPPAYPGAAARALVSIRRSVASWLR